MSANDNKDSILKNINASLKNRKLYPAAHPAITSSMNNAFAFLTDSLREQNSIIIGMVQEALMFEDELISGSDKLYPELIQYMLDKAVDGIIFEKGLAAKELSSLMEILSGPVLKGQELQKEMQAKSIIHITLKSAPQGKKNLLEVYNGAVDVVKNVMGEIRMGKLPKAEPVNKTVDDLTESVLSDPNAIIGLAMIKNYDNYLYNHSVNVSIMSLALGHAMKLERNELHAVGVGALLHDIGKTGVAEQIIRKPGGLSSEEWEKIKEHPVLGSNITKRMEGLDELIGRLIYEHHIKYDYSGYPQTTSKLHPLSQIITICDAYDALTTVRVYQQPYSPAEAIKIMLNFSGRHFNPETLKAFVSVMGVYPVGSIVRLSTNEVAIVTRLNQEKIDSPVVKILYNKDGNPLSEHPEADLSASEVTIITTVNPAVANTDIGKFFENEAAC